MATQKYTNLGKGSLAGAYTAGATTITLGTGEGASFPSTGLFTVALDSPPSFFLQATSRSADVITVGTLGSEGTTAVNKASGVAVTEVVTAGVLDGIRADLHQTGTYAGIPAAEKAGNLYLPTDNTAIWRDTGSVYNAWGPIYGLTPPVEANYSWVNQGVATLSTAGGVSVIANPAEATGDNLRLRVKSRPSSPPWTVTMMFIPNITEANFHMNGICVRESSTGKISFMAHSYGQLIRWSDTTAATTWSSVGTIGYYRASPCWLRVKDDGTNLIWQVSNDGYNFITIRSMVRTVYMAGGADQVGYFIHCENPTYGTGMTVLDWKEA